jgi:hypothetical protein
MLVRSFVIVALSMFVAGLAAADIKYYSADAENGVPGDVRVLGQDSPPVIVSFGVLQGYQHLTDDGAGTVTLEELVSVQRRMSEFGPDILVSVLGPGAFFFAELQSTITINLPAVSNTTGIGPHGPSGTAPGQSTEWGVVSGFEITGYDFCLSSPAAVCNENGFAHGMTVATTQLGSDTYDLGTWTFDAVGDMEAASYYITRTATGGTANVSHFLRGSFHGASIPALPLVGFGALLAALAVAGVRSATGRR